MYSQIYGEVRRVPEEAEMRLHRCCFTGHRPEKLEETPEEVQGWLETQIDHAITDGYTTFISGCAMGADIWAAQIVLRKKKEHPELHLIAATPWPGFSARWSPDWQEQYSDLLRNADLTKIISKKYHNDVFRERNEWMVSHSNRLIAFYNGAPGGTRDMISFAEQNGLKVITNSPKYSEKPKRRKEKENLEVKGTE